MLNIKVEKSINEQINAELYSAYLYLSMSAYFESQSLEGMATWMRAQFEEEQEHAFRFFDYVNERGGRVELAAIEQPQKEWSSVLSVFEDTLAHERVVTEMINNMMEIAIEEKDYATQSFLQWYVDEQVEEEATVEGILSKVERIGDNGNGLLMLDRELGSRPATSITPEE